MFLSKVSPSVAFIRLNEINNLNNFVHAYDQNHENEDKKIHQNVKLYVYYTLCVDSLL